MKIKILQEIRHRVAQDHQISNPLINGERKWRIFTGVRTMLCEKFNTKEDAIAYMNTLWHEEAERYLWKHRAERKMHNTYIW